MTREEFNAIVDDAVKNGADRKATEEYVIAGYGLDATEFLEKALGELNKADLTAKAAELGVEIGKKATKAQIIEAIEAATPEETAK